MAEVPEGFDIEKIEWLRLLDDGRVHAWSPAANGKRSGWCVLVFSVDVERIAEDGEGLRCLECQISIGTAISLLRGSQVYRSGGSGPT